MYIVKKTLKNFSAAHRLVKGYQGNCRNLHGHNYMVAVTFTSVQLDPYDFVIDFDIISQHCDNWVQTHWDHSVLISDDDHPLLEFCRQQDQKHYLIPNGKNTTVEVLSEHLFKQLENVLSQTNSHQCKIIEVEIAESATAKAIYLS